MLECNIGMAHVWALASGPLNVSTHPDVYAQTSLLAEVLSILTMEQLGELHCVAG